MSRVRGQWVAWIAIVAMLCLASLVGYTFLQTNSMTSCVQPQIHSFDQSVNGKLDPQLLVTLRARVNGSSQTIWTLSDKGYISFLIRWRDRLHSFNHTNIFVATLDEETAEFCKANGVPFVHYPEEVGVVKFVLSFHLASFGVAALFSEMDVIWFTDPFTTVIQPMLEQNPSLELLITGHVNHLRVNIGVFYSRPTSSIVVFYSTLATYYHLRRDLWGPTRDQIVFDGHLRNIDELPGLPPWLPGIQWSKISNNVIGAGDGVYRYDQLRAVHTHSIFGSKPETLTKLYEGDMNDGLKLIPLHSKPLDVHQCGFPKCW